MKKLINLFKEGKVIDKTFIILTPLIIVLGIYEFATYEPSNIPSETFVNSSNNEAKAKEEAETKAKEEAEAKAKEEAEAKAKEEAEAKAKEETEAKENVSTTPTINRENIIGTSNKDFKKISTSKPTKVRNDTTGNWKLSKIATTDDILEYAKSYYDNNFTSDDEIHAIVNFTLNTTTCVSTLFDNIISVTIHEYVDKEEHDANKLFSGMVLGDYWIYLDNGDIEKIY
ncbi:hypothetical protein [Clostridium saudiense]|uniref:hypothetical protein n=1 Tax=Clostridium saudiense TaxID=1414720 RepID=UPI0018AC7D11